MNFLASKYNWQLKITPPPPPPPSYSSSSFSPPLLLILFLLLPLLLLPSSPPFASFTTFYSLHHFYSPTDFPFQCLPLPRQFPSQFCTNQRTESSKFPPPHFLVLTISYATPHSTTVHIKSLNNSLILKNCINVATLYSVYIFFR